MTDEIQLNDVLEKKVDFHSLPKEEKERLQNNYIDTQIPEEDRELARKEGYTPPEMFRGLDKYGNPVQAKTWDQFKHGYLEKRETKRDPRKEEYEQMKREMAEMKELLRLQASNSFQSEEDKINSQIQEARDSGDFDAYDRLVLKRNDLVQKKVSVAPKEVKKEPEVTFTPEEQEAMFEFRLSNKEFTQTLGSDDEILYSFDSQVASIARTRPDLKPHEILALAKTRTERVFPDKFTNKKTFMNTQYNNNSTFTPEKKESPKIVFDNLSLSDKLMVESAFKQPPYSRMASKQEVAEAIFSKYLNK